MNYRICYVDGRLSMLTEERFKDARTNVNCILHSVCESIPGSMSLFQSVLSGMVMYAFKPSTGVVQVTHIDMCDLRTKELYELSDLYATRSKAQEAFECFRSMALNTKIRY